MARRTRANVLARVNDAGHVGHHPVASLPRPSLTRRARQANVASYDAFSGLTRPAGRARKRAWQAPENSGPMASPENRAEWWKTAGRATTLVPAMVGDAPPTLPLVSVPSSLLASLTTCCAGDAGAARGRARLLRCAPSRMASRPIALRARLRSVAHSAPHVPAVLKFQQ